MLNVNKMIQSAESCLGWPYVSPGTNDQNGIDCSGLYVKMYRDQGASIYHGSNTIFHDYCSQTGILTSVNQLIPGMAVFKLKAWTEEDKGNKWYGKEPGNLSHIGFVVSVNPLRIIHASSASECVTTDTKIGKWKYWGYLKNVDYGDEPVDGGGNMKAIVTASNGQPVNMRVKPNRASASIMKVPVGAVVDVHMDGSEWTLISYMNNTGYMMTEFLKFEQDDDGGSGTSETIVVDRAVLQDIYNKIDMLLHG